MALIEGTSTESTVAPDSSSARVWGHILRHLWFAPTERDRLLYRVDAKDSTNIKDSVSYGTNGDVRTEEANSRIGRPWIHST